ncbi:hypothetical protein D3C77_691590 [compost metagenome]
MHMGTPFDSKLAFLLVARTENEKYIVLAVQIGLRAFLGTGFAGDWTHGVSDSRLPTVCQLLPWIM